MLQIKGVDDVKAGSRLSQHVESVDGSDSYGREGLDQVPESRFMVFYSCINDSRKLNDEGVVIRYVRMRRKAKHGREGEVGGR